MNDLLRCALPTTPRPDLAEALDRPFLRDATLEALQVARDHPQHAGPTLSRWFRRTRRLGARDRRRVGEAVHGILRHQGVLDRAGATTDAERLSTWQRLENGDRFSAMAPTTPEEDYAAALSVPVPMAAEWLARLGAADAAGLGAALATRAPTTLRANRLKTDRDKLAVRLMKEGIETAPSVLSPDGLRLKGRANLIGARAFRDGWFEIQDEASQLLCDAIPVTPGQTVMDLCAGAGGKSLALAARGATVFAHDIRPRALQELEKRARRAGATVQVTAPRPAAIVLIDAPCSGTGRLRRDPGLRLGLPHTNLDALAQTQRALIDQGAALVEDGGLLVYATCSMLSAENDHSLSVEAWAPLTARTIWPHHDGADGFGWRIWRKRT